MDYVSDVGDEWRDACAPVLKPYNERIRIVNTQIDNIMQKYTDMISELQPSVNEELAPFVTEVDEIRAEVEEDVTEFDASMAMPLPPEPEVNPDDDDWLFDSSRNYMDQLAMYKARKPKQNRGNDKDTDTNTNSKSQETGDVDE